MLLALHRRLAHSTCRKLYLSLAEHGLGGVFTDAECRTVDCAACSVVNARKVRVPRVADALRSSFGVREVAYQDLCQLPKGYDGSKWVSVIVDASSRQLDMRSIKAKDMAISHAVGYIRRAESEGHRVKRWRSDNGGEFWNNEFDSLLRKEGIAQELGAPYTPESQGLVERANSTFKRLLGKLLRTAELPLSVWPALLPGVMQQLNSVVHTTLGVSPYQQAESSKAGKLPSKTVGDIVMVVDPVSKEGMEGIFGGLYSEQAASVILKTASGKWRVRRVHPSAVRFRALQGSREPLAGGNPLLAREVAGDLEGPSDQQDYDLIDGGVDDDDEGPAEQEVNDDDGVYVDLSDDFDSGGAFIASAQSLKDNKAKNQVAASREDVLQGSHHDTDMKELRSFRSNGALGSRISSPSKEVLAKTLTASWRRTWKLQDEGAGDGAGRRVAKSRLYVRGFQDRRDRGWLETHAGTADPGLERIAYLYAFHRWA